MMCSQGLGLCSVSRVDFLTGPAMLMVEEVSDVGVCLLYQSALR